jgi:PHD/YefM family antitoxin component YafN of YafNO toxin-antitoxin module
MIKVSAAEFEKDPKAWQAKAMGEPVVLMKDGREESVLLSFDDYRLLRRRAREVIRIEDLLEEEIAEIEASQMPPGFEHLDREVDSTS